MEENNQGENKEAPIEDETVPIEQVEKVLAESGNKETTEEVEDLTEEDSIKEAAAKEELDKIVIPDTPEEVETKTEVPDIKPAEGQSGTDQLTQQQEPPAIPISKEDNRMKFLQFECQNPNCGGFKMYVNLEDDKEKELPPKLKCINCGKKKSIKRRILDLTFNGYQDYVEPESPDIPTLPEED